MSLTEDKPRCKRCQSLLSRVEIDVTNGKYCLLHGVQVYKFMTARLSSENEALVEQNKKMREELKRVRDAFK